MNIRCVNCGMAATVSFFLNHGSSITARRFSNCCSAVIQRRGSLKIKRVATRLYNIGNAIELTVAVVVCIVIAKLNEVFGWLQISSLENRQHFLLKRRKVYNIFN